MFLAIDIGNTNITLGLFEFDGGRSKRGPSKIWRLSTVKSNTSDEYGTQILDFFHYAAINVSDIRAVAVASVVPVLDSVFAEVSREYLKQKAFFVCCKEKLPMNVLYTNPADGGADRIANAVAGKEFFGANLIIIDFGTATTFDCINKKGEYMGGAIAPGPMISAESLAKRTAKLPLVSIAKPLKAIGKTTAASIQSGIYHGYVGLIKELLSNISAEMGGKPKVIATGGLAQLIIPEIREVKHIVNELTLEGIRLIWEKGRA